MEFLKKNFALLLAFILPIMLIAVVALGTYLPSLFLSTSYNFVYTTCGDGFAYSYNCSSYLRQLYSVEDTKFIINDVNPTLDSDGDEIPDINENYMTRIFLHDTEKNISREILLEEAQKITLNNLVTSPDDVSVSGYYDRGSNDSFLIFGGDSSSFGYYLVKGKYKSKLNFINDFDQYYNTKNFQFVGWVLPGRN